MAHLGSVATFIQDAGTGKTSVTFNYSDAVPVGAFLFLAVNAPGGSSGTTFSATDTKGNVWTSRLREDSNVSNNRTAILTCPVTTAVSTSDTITLSISSGSRATWLVEVHAFDDITGFDVKVANGGSGGGPYSGATPVAAQASQLIFGLVGWSNSAITLDATQSVSEAGSQLVAPSANRALQTVWQYADVSGTRSINGKLSSSTAWSVVATGSNAAAAPIVDPDVEAEQLATSDYTLGTDTTVRLGIRLPSLPEYQIPQNRARLTPVPYLVAGGRAELVPEHFVQALTYADVEEVPATTAGLESPFDTPLPTGHGIRWRPSLATQVPHPEAGTGVTWWEHYYSPDDPADPMVWEYFTGNEPYVDEALVYDSRNGEVSREALVFDGDAWMQQANKVITTGPSFGLFMVLQLHKTESSKATILSTFLTQNVDEGYPLEIVLNRDILRLKVGGHHLDHYQIRRSTASTFRPIILGITVDGTYLRWTVVAERYYTRNFRPPQLHAANNRLFIGRDTDVEYQNRAIMDIFDLDYVPNHIPPSIMYRTANILDSAYGISSGRME